MNYVNPIQLEALVLFDCGKSKTFIRNKLKIKNRLLTKWINDDRTNIKEKAIRMHSFGIPFNRICKYIFVEKAELYRWLTEMNETYIKHAMKREINISRKQDGFGYFIDGICDIY
jgi:hypothetical protein